MNPKTRMHLYLIGEYLIKFVSLFNSIISESNRTKLIVKEKEKRKKSDWGFTPIIKKNPELLVIFLILNYR